MTDHFIIPDTQIKKGDNIDHIIAAGQVIVDRRPEVIVCLGDWWDFPSLSTHNGKGSIHYQNQDYLSDLKAGIAAMNIMLAPLKALQKHQRKNKKKVYNPRLVFCLGNHEYRRNRLEDEQPILKGALKTPEDYLKAQGFEVVDYKDYIEIDGVVYSHNCPQTFSAGCVSRAHLIAQKRNKSWTVGHSQALDIYVSHHLPRIQCLIVGAFYLHDEDYKKGSNDHWRGCVYKHDVSGGSYDPEFISIERLVKEW